MPQSIEHLKPLTSSKSIGRCFISSIFVFLTHFALSLVPRFCYSTSFLLQLVLTAVLLLVVIGLGGWCRRIVGLHASAPAFVFFNLFFIWGVYLIMVRQVVSGLMDVMFNAEVVMLVIGLCRILSSDPGLVDVSSADKFIENSGSDVEAYDKELEAPATSMCHEYPTEGSIQLRRSRFCRRCKAHIKGFDHHCPAFGNCIGQNNYVLFVLILVGFLTTEASYVLCSSKVPTRSQVLDSMMMETSHSMNLVISTMLFSILQLAWQINWRKYPEFQLVVQSQQGQSDCETIFINPHDKGVIQNVKEFLALKE